ncbi:diadenosine tetraphosphate hydrolase [Pollutimonas nitritireducens]|uniref:Diadenosine tetraphosphate hydrolase n=1 Tax=Pollutimonas nitritireducens TaxID=2045209 RepID=A0A2N4UHF9_9BURK|nr:HIT family protein [Pollutimonas nitritireducens]PLC54467.1 diadenosine tetraphosphate hydrolase [Pollutimonas nitritireducens]
MSTQETCPLCMPANETVLWSNDTLRVIAVEDSSHPGFTRVIWRDHVREMTELPAAARNQIMDAVWLVEQYQRGVLQPDKVNLAQFGNMVPHVHWHIIPRWSCDSHFPEAIWAAAPLRSIVEKQRWDARKAQIDAVLPHYHAALTKALSAL